MKVKRVTQSKRNSLERKKKHSRARKKKSKCGFLTWFCVTDNQQRKKKRAHKKEKKKKGRNNDMTMTIQCHKCITHTLDGVDGYGLVATHSTTSPNARVRRGLPDASGRGPTSTVLLVSHAFNTYSVSVTPATRITAGASLFAPVIVSASGPPARTASNTLSGTSISIRFGPCSLPSSEQCI